MTNLANTDDHEAHQVLTRIKTKINYQIGANNLRVLLINVFEALIKNILISFEFIN